MTRKKEPAAVPRGPGRRPKPADGTPEISRATVLAHAVSIAQQESIEDLSMVRLARELGITPGLVHYYVGSRDELISAIVNLAYRERMASMPPLTGDWRHDLEALVRVSHRTMLKWKGVSSYVATRNRSRLFQTVVPGETDWGLAFFDRVGLIFASGGFTPARAAMAYHLLMLFLVAVATADVQRQTPARHREFIRGYVGRSAAATSGGARFLVEPFTEIDTEATLRAGVALLFDGFERGLQDDRARRPRRVSSAAPVRRRTPRAAGASARAVPSDTPDV